METVKQGSPMMLLANLPFAGEAFGLEPFDGNRLVGGGISAAIEGAHPALTEEFVQGITVGEPWSWGHGGLPATIGG